MQIVQDVYIEHMYICYMYMVRVLKSQMKITATNEIIISFVGVISFVIVRYIYIYIYIYILYWGCLDSAVGKGDG